MSDGHSRGCGAVDDTAQRALQSASLYQDRHAEVHRIWGPRASREGERVKGTVQSGGLSGQMASWSGAAVASSPLGLPLAVHLVPSPTRVQFPPVARSRPSTVCPSSQGLFFNGSAFVLYFSAAIVDASSVSPEKEGHNFNSWAASSVSESLPNATHIYPPETYSQGLFGIRGRDRVICKIQRPLAVDWLRATKALKLIGWAWVNIQQRTIQNMPAEESDD